MTVRSHRHSTLLETESRLQLNHSPRESCPRPSKVWIRDDGAGVEEAYGREIQLVEGVEEVGADLESSPFATASDLSEYCLFKEAQVDAVTFWPSE